MTFGGEIKINHIIWSTLDFGERLRAVTQTNVILHIAQFSTIFTTIWEKLSLRRFKDKRLKLLFSYFNPNLFLHKQGSSRKEYWSWNPLFFSSMLLMFKYSPNPFLSCSNFFSSFFIYASKTPREISKCKEKCYKMLRNDNSIQICGRNA